MTDDHANPQAAEPAGSDTVVWRRPVGSIAPIGGEEARVTGTWSASPRNTGGGWPAVA